MEIRKSLRLPLPEFRRRHLRLVEVLTGVRLTDPERDLLAVLLGEPRRNPLGPESRRRAMRELGISRQVLANRLKGLAAKGYVHRESDAGVLEIRDYLHPDEAGQAYRIKLEVACSA